MYRKTLGVGFGSEEHAKLEQDAMSAGADEEGKFTIFLTSLERSCFGRL